MKTYHKNPRTLTHKQQAQLLESLEDLGDLSGIVHNLDTDEIIGGNQRSSIFNINTCEIEMTHEADTPDEQGTVGLGFVIWKGKRYTYRQVRWDAKRAERANIQANKLGGSWDFDVLANQFEVDDLLTWGFEPFELGIDDADDEPNADADTEPQTSRAEELQAEWGTELGQMWQCGPHRVICGDCTDEAVVGRLRGGERAEICFTSPPYLDMREYEGADVTVETVMKFIPVAIENSNYQIVNLGMKFSEFEVVPYWDSYVKAFKDAGQRLLAWNIWDKTQAGSVSHATNMFFITHEWLFVFGRSRKDLNRTIPNDLEGYAKRHGEDFLSSGFRSGVRKADGRVVQDKKKGYTHHQIHSVIQQTPELGAIRSDHPATFPVGLPEKYIEAMTAESDTVFDPFLGSGTTLIAAHNLKRVCYGCELSPAYVAVILQRFKDHSGIQPELIE